MARTKEEMLDQVLIANSFVDHVKKEALRLANCDGVEFTGDGYTDYIKMKACVFVAIENIMVRQIKPMTNLGTETFSNLRKF